MSEVEVESLDGGVLLDALGAKVVRTLPSGQVAVVLDLAGRVNKSESGEREEHRYAFSAGMAAELVAELVVAGQEAATAGSDLEISGGKEFAKELELAIAAEQERRGLTKESPS